MITEDYVSFETAKLLKGFDADECEVHYDPEDHTQYDITLQMAMKWLRKKYNLHITLPYYIGGFYGFEICDIKKSIIVGYDAEDTVYVEPEKACEAAIKYCLENLIKNEDEEESDIPTPKTVNEAISTLEKILSDKDKEYLLKNGAISVHDSLGRWIRNEWGLWTGSELKDELMNMNKGLNHPDDMSNYIIEEFIKYWNNKI